MTTMTVTETGERQSIELLITKKVGFSAQMSMDIGSVATAVAIAFCEKAEGYDLLTMDMEKFRVQCERRSSFVVVTDAGFIPVLKEIGTFNVHAESGAKYELKASEGAYEAAAKEKRAATFTWAHVTLQAGATDSDVTVEQTIRSYFTPVGFTVTEVKPMRDSLGFSTGKFHVAFDIGNDLTYPDINGAALKRLKNMALPSGLIAYTNLSKELVDKVGIRKCCFSLVHDRYGGRNPPCTCTSAKTGARVGDKRENERAALMRIVARQQKAQKQ